jgi:hypothetical protein
VDRQLQIRLRDALYVAFQNEAAFDQQLLGRLNKTLQELSSRDHTYPVKILSVIEAADAEGWIGNLLAAATACRPADAVLERVRSEVSAQLPPPGVDHFEACRLSGGHVMIDRHRLRAALRGMVHLTGRRILVVKGGDHSGKSHSLQLISYLRLVRGGFTPVIVDLRDFDWKAARGEIIEPRDVADRIVRTMRYDFTLDPAPRDGQWSRWVQDFCVQFESRAIDDTKQWWIVIDTLDKVLVQQPVLDLIKELALRVNRTLTSLRLVLIGYGETFPGSVQPIVDEEVIHPIGQDELIEFFVLAFDQLGLAYDLDEVAMMVRRVLDQLDIGQPDYLDRLGALAYAELAKATDGRS